jgi:hypothetical protein
MSERHSYTLHPARFHAHTLSWQHEQPRAAGISLQAAKHSADQMRAFGYAVEIQRDDGLWLASNGQWEAA